MSVVSPEASDFGFFEWHRLSGIAEIFESRMRLAYTRAIRDGRQVNKLELRQVITGILVRVCRTSADVYGLVFNPNSPVYIKVIDKLVEKFVGVVDSPLARDEVKRILPHDITLQDRKKRLNTFGLDAASAVQVEKYRQTIGTGSSAEKDVERVRMDKVRIRGNLLALTETNRVVNASLEALWLDNMPGQVSKSVTYLDASLSDINNLPKTGYKEIVTRRDSKVCKYCDPLDGITARIGQKFDTDYGYFDHPPFHPRCRCFVILSARKPL